MLTIRLRPVGKKHQRSFRIVVADKKTKLTGKFIEDLGWYNPHFDKFEIKEERVKYWLSIGAEPSDTVHNLLIDSGILKGKKKPVHKVKKKTQEEAVQQQEETQQQEEIKQQEETTQQTEKEIKEEKKSENSENSER